MVCRGTYVVTYCGGAPYWWLPGTHGGGMHQISSRGWCHDRRAQGNGFVHHLPREHKIAVLTCEAAHDRVLRERVRADGLTAEEYARKMAAGHGDNW